MGPTSVPHNPLQYQEELGFLTVRRNNNKIRFSKVIVF